MLEKARFSPCDDRRAEPASKNLLKKLRSLLGFTRYAQSRISLGCIEIRHGTSILNFL